MRRKLKTKRLIDLHKEWCETKRLPEEGLCESVWTTGVSSHSAMTYRNVLDKYFKPTITEALTASLLTGESTVYWASGLHELDPRRKEAYTERRQNIVLLTCAILGEL